MNAIILAAGRGSRMQKLTETRHKSQVKIGGRTLLDWQTGALRAAGIDRVVVVRGYLGESLQGEFETVDNPRWDVSNMVVTLTCAEAFLSSAPCLVSYSDIVYRSEHVRHLLEAGGDIRLTYDREWEALWSLRFPDPLSDAETFDAKGGRLREIGGSPASRDEVKGQYMGLLYFTPKGWASVREFLDGLSSDAIDRLDMTALLRRLLERGASITAVPIAGGWCEIDSEGDLRAYEDMLALADRKGKPWTHDFRS
ncbi:MAG TPA: phosphocholine cytidylyltransferase family protein [Solidesulfovibrio sp.]|nr:transferase [Desulfovibrio sp.]HML60430.1 phosphocholine cytidylyltransferase family protein [Solidesulfovibrio sp.]